MDEVTYGEASVIVSLGSSIGTIFVYLTAPLIITLFSWEFVLFASAAIGLISTVLWAVLKDRTYDETTVLPEAKVSSDREKGGFSFPKAAIFPIIFIALIEK
jgi:MFS family permease